MKSLTTDALISNNDTTDIVNKFDQSILLQNDSFIKY